MSQQWGPKGRSGPVGFIPGRQANMKRVGWGSDLLALLGRVLGMKEQ